MKARSSSLVAACLAAMLAAVLVGCPHPGMSARRGSLTVSIKNSINARTLLPAISMEAASYAVLGSGPNGASFSESSNGDPVTVSDLPFGTWTVTVNALNKDLPPTIIGQGQATASVTPGQAAAVTITVTPLGGSGSLSLTVTWVASLQNPSIQASLVPFVGDAATLDFAVSGNQATYSNARIAAGYYTLVLQLLENGCAVNGAVEVVRIVYGQTTSGRYDFSSVNRGTMTVTITPALANPIPMSITGVPAVTEAGSSITATASVGDGTANVVYAWYLGGASQRNSQSSWTFGSDLVPGCYRLDVTAFTADGLRAGSATASFQVTAASEHSLVGDWNAYRAWFKDINPTFRFAADGTFIGWEDYAETIQNNNGTWSLTGDTFTLTFIHGGPGAGVSLSGTLTWVNANQAQVVLSDPPATLSLYREGFEPGGWLMDSPQYPPVELVRDTTAHGSLPSDGLALYEYVAGPNADTTVFSSTGDLQFWIYESDRQTPASDRISKDTETVALTPYQTYFIALTHRPLVSGDYSLLVTEVPAYVGTWVNPSFNGNQGAPGTLPGKIVMTPGSWDLYDNDFDTAVMVTVSFTLVDSFFIGSDHYFKGDLAGAGGSAKEMVCVSNNGTALAIAGGSSDYPTAPIQGGGAAYWRRQ